MNNEIDPSLFAETRPKLTPALKSKRKERELLISKYGIEQEQEEPEEQQGLNNKDIDKLIAKEQRIKLQEEHEKQKLINQRNLEKQIQDREKRKKATIKREKVRM